MPPGLSGSPPSFSRRAYYNRPSCNHQPSASLAFDIEGYGNSLIQYSPLPADIMRSRIKRTSAPLAFFFPFLFLFIRRVSRDVGVVCSKFAGRGTVRGFGEQVAANGLKTEPRGNRRRSSFWWEPRLLRYWILVVLPSREWMGLGFER